MFFFFFLFIYDMLWSFANEASPYERIANMLLLDMFVLPASLAQLCVSRCVMGFMLHVTASDTETHFVI